MLDGINSVFKKFLSNCKEIWELIISTKETETQKAFKETTKSLSIILANVFFIFILLLLLLWGIKLVVQNTPLLSILTSINNFKTWYKYWVFLALIVCFLFAVSLTIKLLLYLYTWIRLIDLFKLYIYVELIFLFVNYSKTRWILLQL